jgi:hypothetical protein
MLLGKTECRSVNSDFHFNRTFFFSYTLLEKSPLRSSAVSKSPLAILYVYVWPFQFRRACGPRRHVYRRHLLQHPPPPTHPAVHQCRPTMDASQIFPSRRLIVTAAPCVIRGSLRSNRSPPTSSPHIHYPPIRPSIHSPNETSLKILTTFPWSWGESGRNILGWNQVMRYRVLP